MEVYNPNSKLYQFGPDVAFFSLAVQKYRDRFLAEVTPKGRETLPDAYLAETLGIIDALCHAACDVIVSNLALPIERMFGNYSALTGQSLYSSVLKIQFDTCRGHCSTQSLSTQRRHVSSQSVWRLNPSSMSDFG